MFGADADRQYYFSSLGHFKDYLKLIPDLSNPQPTEFAEKPKQFAYHKSSTIFKLFHSALTGEDFAGRKYSTLSQMMETGDLVQSRTQKVGNTTRLEQVIPFTLAQVVNLMPISMRSAFEIGSKKDEIDGVKVFSDWTSAALYTPDVIYKKKWNRPQVEHISYIGRALNAVRDILPMIGEPVSIDVEKPSGKNMLDKGAFHILWSPKDGVARAVIERMNPDTLKDPVAYRGGGFREDTVAGTPFAEDFRASGSDRGHLAADANYNTYALKNNTYVLTNVTHQAASFNRGVWARLEKEIRQMARKDEVVVVTAPILDDWGMQSYGKGKVKVPRRFVKIVANKSTGVVTAWALDNEGSTKATKAFKIPLSKAQKIAGIKLENL